MGRKRMKKLLIMLATAIAVLVMPLSASAEGGFTTERYDVSVKVSENNVYSVTNTIKVNFYSERHGIYLYVPYGGKMTRVINGEQVTSRYRAKIKNMSVQGDDYETYTETAARYSESGTKTAR